MNIVPTRRVCGMLENLSSSVANVCKERQNKTKNKREIKTNE